VHVLVELALLRATLTSFDACQMLWWSSAWFDHQSLTLGWFLQDPRWWLI